MQASFVKAELADAGHDIEDLLAERGRVQRDNKAKVGGAPRARESEPGGTGSSACKSRLIALLLPILTAGQVALAASSSSSMCCCLQPSGWRLSMLQAHGRQAGAEAHAAPCSVLLRCS